MNRMWRQDLSGDQEGSGGSGVDQLSLVAMKNSHPPSKPVDISEWAAGTLVAQHRRGFMNGSCGKNQLVCIHQLSIYSSFTLLR